MPTPKNSSDSLIKKIRGASAVAREGAIVGGAGTVAFPAIDAGPSQQSVCRASPRASRHVPLARQAFASTSQLPALQVPPLLRGGADGKISARVACLGLSTVAG